MSTKTIPFEGLVDMTAIATDPQQSPQEPDRSSAQTPMAIFVSILAWWIRSSSRMNWMKNFECYLSILIWFLTCDVGWITITWCSLARGELALWLSLVSPKIFFTILSPDEVWVLATVASGLLYWGHLIFNNIIDLTALTLLYENWTELDDDIPVFHRADLQPKWTNLIINDLYNGTESTMNWLQLSNDTFLFRAALLPNWTISASLNHCWFSCWSL